MNLAVAACLVTANLVAADPAPRTAAPNKHDIAAGTYEHLATVIIEVRKTEDAVVHGILQIYYEEALDHLAGAEKDEKNRAKHLDDAAAQITNVANEGDKRVQAIRQRLAKAGHTHNSDADTKDDYLFVNSAEKKALLALARKVAQLGPKATPAAISAAAKELTTTYDKAVAAE